jgi:pimeloyl-ACP methyl ester carboxylesterase
LHLEFRTLRSLEMNTITTKDGVEIFYKDWGKGQPIVFSHGWPLSADDWDAQMLFFLSKGLPRDRPRPARPWAIHPNRRRP